MSRQRIGFDVDGLFAKFSPAFQQVLIATTGYNLFTDDGDNPSSWDWDLNVGYTKVQRMAAFEWCDAQPAWWENLDAIEPNTGVLREALPRILAHHDVYFITNRGASTAKMQTERWLRKQFRVHPLTTLIVASRMKGRIAAALKLNAYIDDNYDNALDVVVQSPTTRGYLLNRNYNQPVVVSDPLDPLAKERAILEQRRVRSFEGFLFTEGLVPDLVVD